MKTILKAGSLLALAAVIGSSCSVEYKTRHGKRNAIDVGMNGKDLQNSQAVVVAAHNSAIIAGR